MFNEAESISEIFNVGHVQMKFCKKMISLANIIQSQYAKKKWE